MVVQHAKARLVGDLLTNGHLANCGRTNDKQQSWRRRSQPGGHAENIVVIYGTTNGFSYTRSGGPPLFPQPKGVRHRNAATVQPRLGPAGGSAKSGGRRNDWWFWVEQ